jgi:hypothetical protein
LKDNVVLISLLQALCGLWAQYHSPGSFTMGKTKRQSATRKSSAKQGESHGGSLSNNVGLEAGHRPTNAKCRSSPPAYGAVLWTLLYAGFVVAVFYLLPFCMTDNQEASPNDCAAHNSFYVHSSMAWSTDLFLFGAVGIFCFSLFVKLREKMHRILYGTAFACFSVAFFCQGIAKMTYGHQWEVVTFNGMNITLPSQPYAILIMIQTTLQAVALLLIGVMIHASTWKVLLRNQQHSRGSKWCNGILGLRVAVWGALVGFFLVLAGCTLAILANRMTNQDASMLTYHFLQSGTALFLLSRTFAFVFAAFLWTKHALLEKQTIQGLSNSATAQLIILLQLFWGFYQLVFFIMEAYFDYQMDTVQSDINNMVLQYAWFMTLHGSRNVILSFGKTQRIETGTRGGKNDSNKRIVTVMEDDEDTDESVDSQQERETVEQESGNILLSIDLEQGCVESSAHASDSVSQIRQPKDDSGLGMHSTMSLDASVVASTTENDDQYLQFSPSLSSYGAHPDLQYSLNQPPKPLSVKRTPSEQSSKDLEAAEQLSLEVAVAMSKSYEDEISRRRSFSLFGQSRTHRGSTGLSEAPVLIADQMGQYYNGPYKNDIEAEQGTSIRRNRSGALALSRKKQLSKQFSRGRFSRLGLSRSQSNKSVQFKDDLSFIDFPDEDSQWTDPIDIARAQAALMALNCGAIESEQEQPPKEYAATPSRFETIIEKGAAGTMAAASVATATVGGALAALTSWRSKREQDNDTTEDVVDEGDKAATAAAAVDLSKPVSVVDISNPNNAKEPNTSTLAFFEELTSFLLPRMKEKKRKRGASYDEINDTPLYPSNPCVDASQKLAESASNVSKSLVSTAASTSHCVLDNVIACSDNACKEVEMPKDMFPSLVKEHNGEVLPPFASSTMSLEDSQDAGIESSPSCLTHSTTMESISEFLPMKNSTKDTTAEKKAPIIPKTKIDWNKPSRDDDSSNAMPERYDQHVDRIATKVIASKKVATKVNVVMMEGRDDEEPGDDDDASSSRYNPFANYDYGCNDGKAKKSRRLYHSNRNGDSELQTILDLKRGQSQAAPGTVKNLAQFWSSKVNGNVLSDVVGRDRKVSLSQRQ